MRCFYLNEHAITGGVHYTRVCYCQLYRLQQIAVSQSSRPCLPTHSNVYMHVVNARHSLQGNLTPVGGHEGIVFLIHCLLLQQLTQSLV